MSEDIAATLEKAADLIETVGHCKDKLFTQDPETLKPNAYCLMGGLVFAMKNGGQVLIDRYVAVLGVALDGNPLGAMYRLIEWNNAPERTAAEVVDLLKTAAKDVRNANTPTPSQ